MDTLSIIILTAVVNAIVTGVIGGIVLYRIQKKIDNSYFEYQTKFSINHPKSVDTLKTLYQKFIAMKNVVNELISQRRIAGAETKAEEQESILVNLLEDFGHYFTDNRLYLPAKFADNISRIQSAATIVFFSLFIGLMSTKADKTGWLSWDDLREPLRLTSTKGIVTSYDNPESLISDMQKKLDSQAKTLENLYKSVADTPTKH